MKINRTTRQCSSVFMPIILKISPNPKQLLVAKSNSSETL